MHYPNGAEEKREVWSAAISPPPRACWEPVCCFDRCLCWLIYQQITEFISPGRQIPEFNRKVELRAPDAEVQVRPHTWTASGARDPGAGAL